MKTPDDLNIVKNPTFAEGRGKPRWWEWSVSDGQPEWQRPESSGDTSGGVSILSPDDRTQCTFAQVLGCASDQTYRVEIVVSAECASGYDLAGVYLRVGTLDAEGQPLGDPSQTVPVESTADKMICRVFIHAAKTARKLVIEVGLRNATGRVCIHTVRAIPIGEIETVSHPLAVLAPPYAISKPPAPRRVALYCDREQPTLQQILQGRFGKRNVRLGKLKDAHRDTLDGAIVLAGANSAHSIRYRNLLEWSERGVVVVSLELFAGIVNRHQPGTVETRTIRQPDDPLNACAVCSHYLTDGFAMEDFVPYWSDPSASGVMSQRHIKSTWAFKSFCKENGFEVILRSETDADVTSGHPVVLCRSAENGALVVMDTHYLETCDSGEDVENFSAHLLFNALGLQQISLGQFTVPETDEGQLVSVLREFGQRFEGVTVHNMRQDGQDLGIQWMEISTDSSVFSQPRGKRPTVMIRTGLNGCDWDGIYGTLYWMKQLLRPQPYQCPYVTDLASRLRVVWLPICCMGNWGKYSAEAIAQSGGMEAEFEPDSIKCLIDITTRPDHDLRVLFAGKKGECERLGKLLADLFEWSSDDGCFYRGPNALHRYSRRGEWTWHADGLSLKCSFAPDAFQDPLHRAALGRGAVAIRVELPGGWQFSPANSIQRTGRCAILVELLVGLQLGLVLANRWADTRVASSSWCENGQSAVTLAQPHANGYSLEGLELGRTNKPCRMPPGAVLWALSGNE